ncbi:histidine phosphatase family protein [Saprospiraceae bacterium]|nr:histidine phosphatase family protein [Saprospiraceae bacterium]
MTYSLRFLSIFFVLLIVSIGCKGIKKTDGHEGQLRYSGEDNKGTVSISDFIDANKITLICVRHAEKIKAVSNPSLTIEGKQRAKDLSELLANVEVDAIYSSDFNRTLETVKDLSSRTKLPIRRYDPSQPEDLKNKILSNHQNGVVVVVGHSNSTPAFVNVLLSEDKYSSFDESDYDNIFVVSVAADGSVESHLLEYGAENAIVSHK